jgi:hypothetical protein
MPDQSAPGYTPQPRGSNTVLVVILVAVGLLGAVVCCGGLAFVGLLLPYQTLEKPQVVQPTIQVQDQAAPAAETTVEPAPAAPAP